MTGACVRPPGHGADRARSAVGVARCPPDRRRGRRLRLVAVSRSDPSALPAVPEHGVLRRRLALLLPQRTKGTPVRPVLGARPDVPRLSAARVHAAHVHPIALGTDDLAYPSAV